MCSKKLLKLIFLITCILTSISSCQNDRIARKLVESEFNKDFMINFCMKDMSYWSDTLILTNYNSLQDSSCAILIFQENNKIEFGCVPDILPSLKTSNSTWLLNSEKRTVTLDIIDQGIDDYGHYKSEYSINKFSLDTIELVISKVIVNE